MFFPIAPSVLCAADPPAGNFERNTSNPRLSRRPIAPAAPVYLPAVPLAAMPIPALHSPLHESAGETLEAVLLRAGVTVDRILYPERPANGRVFALRRHHLRYIRRYRDVPGIERAMRESFWLCRACGFSPWDEPTWLWFADVPVKDQRILARISSQCRRLDREIRRAKKAD